MAWGDRKGTLTGNANSIPDPAACSGSVAVVVGDLVVAVCGQQTNLTVIGCSDNLGNSYSAQNAGTDPGSPTARAFYSRVTVAGTLTAVNFDTTASTNDWAGFAAVYTGPFLAPPIDANPANGTADTTSPFTCPATGTLAISNELVVCWGAANQSTAWAATSPLLLDGNANNSTNVKVALGSKVVSATTDTSPAFTAGANPTTCILGTMSFKQEIISTDGVISAQSATAAGTGASSSSSTDGAIAAQAATVAGSGKSTSTGAGVLAAQSATAAGAGTVETPAITGTGALVAQSASAEGEGLSTTLSTDGAILAQSASIAGVGKSSSVSTDGAISSQAATAAGAGLSASSGTGVLAAPPATVAGVGVSLSTGTGSLSAQAADVTGNGTSLSTGTGALVAQAASVAGTGTSKSVGTGVLTAQEASVAGTGVSVSTGTGALPAGAADVDGTGLSASLGTGILAAQAASIAGTGTVADAGAITGTGALEAGAATVVGVGVVIPLAGVVVTGGGAGVGMRPRMPPRDPDPRFMLITGGGSLRAQSASVRGTGEISWDSQNAAALLLLAA